MKKNNLKRFLASLLAVLMLSQVTGVAPGVFADNSGNTATYEAGEYQAPKYHNGTAIIKKDSSDAEVRALVTKAIVENYNDVDPATLSGMEWEYYCTGDRILGLLGSKTKTDWVSINGHTDVTAKATYKFPSLADNDYKSYQVRLKGTTVEYTLTKADATQSSITASNEVKDIVIPYTSGTEYTVSALNESIFNAYVTSTTPAGLTYDKLSYTGTVAEGQQTITISYAGDEEHYGTNATVTVNFVDNRVDTFSLKDRPKTLNIGYVGDSINVAETENQIRKQLVNQLSADVGLNEVKVEFNGVGGYKELSEAGIWAHMKSNSVSTNTDIRLTYAGDATHKPFTAFVKDIKFDDNRVASSIVLKENASITYNMDAENMKEQIFKNAIDWEKSDLPADAEISDFTFEYKTLPSATDKLPVDKDKLESLKQFAPIEGGKRDTWLDPLDYPMMGAGDQTILIKFNGNSEFKPSDKEGALKVEKANVTVTINDPIKVIYAGEKIDAKKYVSTDPADPALEIYIVYVGVNTNKESTIYLQVSGDKQNFIDGISDFQKEYLKYAEEDTLRGKLNDGITVGEFKEMLNGILSYVDNDFTKFLVNIALNKYGLTYDNLKDLLGVLEKVSGIANNLRLAIGSPAHAGQYFAVAIAVNDNYNTGVSLPGSVTVLKNWKGVKLEKNPLFDAVNNTITAKNNTITVSQAEKIAKSVCILTKDDEELDNSQTSVHYWFTGVNKIYAKSTMPAAPGKYIVTATVRGGDFFAFPKTFSFTIVADPTSNT